MPRDQQRWQEGDHVYKGQEEGRIVILKNRQTGDPFPMVWITKGPRKGQREYPSRGWRLDDGSYGGNERPSYDEDADTIAHAHNRLRGTATPYRAKD